MKKRVFSIILTLLMVFMAIPTSAWYVIIPDDDDVATSDYEIFVGGVGLYTGYYLATGSTKATTTKPEGTGYAYYDNGILYLKDYSYNGNGTVFVNGETAFNAAIYHTGSDELNVRIEGDCSLQPKASGRNGTFGIYTTGIMTLDRVDEAAVLTIKNATMGGLFGLHVIPHNGIYNFIECTTAMAAFYNVGIVDGTYNIHLTDENATGSSILAGMYFSMSAGNLKIDCTNEAIIAEEVDFTGGTVDIASKNNCINSNGNMTIQNSECSFASDEGRVISSETGTILFYRSDCTIYSTELYSDYCCDNIHAYGGIEIKYSTIKAPDPKRSTGKFIYTETGDVTVYESTINSPYRASGALGTVAHGFYLGKGDLYLEDSNVYIEGNSTLVFVQGNIDIDGGNTVFHMNRYAFKQNVYCTGTFTYRDVKDALAATAVVYSDRTGYDYLKEFEPFKVENYESYQYIRLINKYDIYVGGVGLVSGDYLTNGSNAATAHLSNTYEGGYARYTGDTLILDNYSYSGGGYAPEGIGFIGSDKVRFGIYKPSGDLTIKLKGENTLNLLDYTNSTGIGVYANDSELSIEAYDSETDATLNIKNCEDYGIRAFIFAAFNLKGTTVLNIEDTYNAINAAAAVMMSNTLNINDAEAQAIITDGYVITIGANISVNDSPWGMDALMGISITNGDINMTNVGTGITCEEGPIGIEGADVTISSEANGIEALGSFVTIKSSNIDIVSVENAIYALEDVSIVDSHKGCSVTLKSTTTTSDDYCSAIKCEGKFIYDDDATIWASTTPNGTLGKYNPLSLSSYDYISVISHGDYPVYVGGVGLSDGYYLPSGSDKWTTYKPEGGYAFYQKGELVLNNYSYSGEGLVIGSQHFGIYRNKGDLKITLIGNNSIDMQNSSSSIAIYVVCPDKTATLTIEGGDYDYIDLNNFTESAIHGGKVKINNVTVGMASDEGYYGIFSNEGIETDGAGIRADVPLEAIRSNGYVRLYETGTDLKADYCISSSAENVILSGGSHILKSGTGNGIQSHGDLVISDGAIVNMFGEAEAIRVYGSLTMQDSTLKATCKESCAHVEGDVSIIGESIVTLISDSEEGTAQDRYDSNHYALEYFGDMYLSESLSAFGYADPNGTKGEVFDVKAYETYDRVEIKEGSAADEPDEVEPEIWVSGVGMAGGDYLATGATETQTTKPSGGYAYYENGVLTLNNYQCEGGGYVCDVFGMDALIYSEKDIEIILKGTNILSGDNDVYFAIKTDGELILSGSGSLDVNNLVSSGVVSKGTIVITGGNISVTSGENQTAISCEYDIMVNGGKLNVISNSSGIYSAQGGAVINGGTVNIDAKGFGIYGYDKTGMTSILITGGTVNITSSRNGIYAKESCIYISGGNVTVSSGEDAIYGEYGVSIEGGTVSAKCTNTYDGDDTYRAINPGSSDLILSSGLEVKASTEPGGTLGSFVLGNLEMYDYITIKKAPPAGGYPIGDIDLDGKVSAVDSNLIMRVIAGSYILEEGSASAENADIDGDGKITAVDSNLIKRIVAGNYRP